MIGYHRRSSPQAEVVLITFLKIYTLISIVAFVLGIVQRSIFFFCRTDLTRATGYGYIIFLTIWLLVTIYAIFKFKKHGFSFIAPLCWLIYFAVTFVTAPFVEQLMQTTPNFNTIHVIVVYLIDLAFVIAYARLLKQLKSKAA